MRRVSAVDAHLDGERRILTQQRRRSFIHHRPVREQRDEDSLALRVAIDLWEVTPRDNLAPGQRQPENAGPLQDVEHAADLSRAEIRTFVRVERDVAKVASQVARRRQFEETRERTALGARATDDAGPILLHRNCQSRLSDGSMAPISSNECTKASTSASARSALTAYASIKFRAKVVLSDAVASDSQSCSALAFNTKNSAVRVTRSVLATPNGTRMVSP